MTTYLDNAATTPIDPRVREALEPWLEADFGNPSSRHPLGVRAAEAIDRARERVARAVGARPQEVVFTSGGTEANNLAVLGAARARAAKGRRVVVGPTEHASVRVAARALAEEGFEVATAPLRPGGELDVEGLAALVDERTVLVALMLVNNELGSIYPVRRVARLVRARAPRAHVHTDAVQALGKLELSVAELGVDSLALSAHKVHGPKGAGALVRRADAPLRPLLFGGSQEHGLRAGTENVASIVATGVAVELAEARRLEAEARLIALRERFETGLAELGTVTPLLPFERGSLVPGICSLRVTGAPAEVWLHHLEAEGVYAGAGSACQARTKEISPVARAFGLDDEAARRLLRFSFAATTEEAEVERALAALARASATLATLVPGEARA